MVFTNATGNIPDGMITRSESQNTSGIEIFDLRNSNINLSLTNELFATADKNAITVTTVSAKGTSTLNTLAVTAPQNGVTFKGGDKQDIVIVNDAFFNGKSELYFGGDIATDILRVDGGATVREADMGKISGLDRMELVSTQDHSAQTWVIELTKDFSGTIWVSPDVAAGSKLYIDAAKVGTANVNILRNSNVSVLNLDDTAFVALQRLLLAHT